MTFKYFIINVNYCIKDYFQLSILTLIFFDIIWYIGIAVKVLGNMVCRKINFINIRIYKIYLGTYTFS